MFHKYRNSCGVRIGRKGLRRSMVGRSSEFMRECEDRVGECRSRSDLEALHMGRNSIPPLGSNP